MIWTIALPIMAALSVLFFHQLLKRADIYESKRINKKIESNSLKRSELIQTLLSFLVFALTGLLIDFLSANEQTKIYTNLNEYSLTYTIASLFFALAIHDFYFYITHRFMHWKPIFNGIHYLHHRSHSPNAFSTFSFHPVEAVIQIGIVPLIALMVPIHSAVLFVFASFLLFISVYGHCGYEFRGSKAKIFAVFSNSVHHNQHHRFVHYNFGLFLVIWDRLFGTLHPQHESESEQFRSK